MSSFFPSSSSISLEVKFGNQVENYSLPSSTSYRDFLNRVAQRFQLEPSSIKFIGWKKKPPSSSPLPASLSISDLLLSHDLRVKLMCIGSSRTAQMDLLEMEDKLHMQKVSDAIQEEEQRKEDERLEAERIRREEDEEERRRQEEEEEQERERKREEERNRRRDFEMQRIIQQEKTSTASVTFNLKATTDHSFIAPPASSSSSSTSTSSSSSSSRKLFPVHLPRNLLAHVISAGVAFPLTFRVTLSNYNEDLAKAMQESLRSHLISESSSKDKKNDSDEMDIEGQSESVWRTADYFRASGVCYASVADFDVKNESSVIVPADLLEYLGGSEGCNLKLTSVMMSKGKSIRLKALNESDWLEVDEEERKALLEWCLRHHHHIFPGAVLTISSNLAAPLYRFLCVKTEPNDEPINITDTDLNTEIITKTEEKNGTPPSHTPLEVFEEKDKDKMREIYKADLPKDACTYFTFAVGDSTASYSIDLKAVSGDPDLYAAHSSCRLLPSLPLRPGPTCYQWAANSKGSDRLILNADDPKFALGTYYLAVYAYDEDAKFELSITRTSKPRSHSSNAINSSSNNDSVVACSNCKKSIPERSFALHESQCQRMNVWCAPCSVALPIREKSKHDHLNHHPILCLCGESFTLPLYLIHAEQACTLRLVPCTYCPLWLELRGRGEHQAECGNRHAFCKICHAQFQRKTIKRHIAQTHYADGSKHERDVTWREYY